MDFMISNNHKCLKWNGNTALCQRTGFDACIWWEWNYNLQINICKACRCFLVSHPTANRFRNRISAGLTLCNKTPRGKTINSVFLCLAIARKGVRQSGFSASDQKPQRWEQEVGWATTADILWPWVMKLDLRRQRGSCWRDGQSKAQGPLPD